VLPAVGRLWHRLDDRYALPQSSLVMLFRCPGVESVWNKEETQQWTYDSKASIHSLMLASCFHNALAQETYDADLAGLNWSLSKTSHGLQLSCGGYSNQLSRLGLALMKRLWLPIVSAGSESGSGDNEDSIRPVFLTDKFVMAAKDRTVRHLKSYLKSTRADSLAMYYTGLFASLDSKGIEHSLEAAETVTLESLCDHWRTLLHSSKLELDCMYSGNISETDATTFFDESLDIFQTAKHTTSISDEARRQQQAQEGISSNMNMKWRPGPTERRLAAGEDIALHFQSENTEELNGAVAMTFQSPVAGYRGGDDYNVEDAESRLKYSAAIRLLCHMLREPLFDELRTKQQLGYVVSSYYNQSFSTVQAALGSCDDGAAAEATTSSSKSVVVDTVPVDSIVVYVLSQKYPPPVIAQRIDTFLQSFGEQLHNGTLSSSQIRDHADSLSIKLLKPIQKLGTEVSSHFHKVRHYGPMDMDTGTDGRSEMANSTGSTIPWNNAKALAASIRSLTRQDLSTVWNDVVAMDRPASRSRIVAHVYGNKYPLGAEHVHVATSSNTTTHGQTPTLFGRYWSLFSGGGVPSPRVARLDTLSSIMKHRQTLRKFDNVQLQQRRTLSSSSSASLAAGVSKQPTTRNASSLTMFARWGTLVTAALGTTALGVYYIMTSTTTSRHKAITNTTKRGQ
jgi:secreted Zn-dependent insulinase-like peptidase